jgi:hypothetical protein
MQYDHRAVLAVVMLLTSTCACAASVDCADEFAPSNGCRVADIEFMPNWYVETLVILALVFEVGEMTMSALDPQIPLKMESITTLSFPIVPRGNTMLYVVFGVVDTANVPVTVANTPPTTEPVV